jgi:alpha-N-arabinofuranosidase
VDISVVEHEINPLLFGVFFEEINHAGVGGLYAELIQNRAFEANVESGISSKSGVTYISLESYQNSSFFVRHCDYFGFISYISNAIDEQDSTFSLISNGLINKQGYVSLESFDFPGYFLRADMKRIKLENNDKSQAFASDASFKLGPGLASTNGVSFESATNPGYYICQTNSDDSMCMEPKQNLIIAPYGQATAAECTFYIRDPNYSQLSPWKVYTAGDFQANIQIVNTFPLNPNNTWALQLDIKSGTKGTAGVSNSGYWGIKVDDSASYQLSFFARADNGFKGRIFASLQSADNSRIYATVLVDTSNISTSWNKFTATLRTIVSPGKIDDSSIFVIETDSKSGTLWLDVVSLFPVKTFNERPNGLRPDLAQSVYDLSPAFIRFPGGCYVEGDHLAHAFRWKKSIGPIEQRPGHYDLWGYWSEDGLGYFEYLQLCEDLQSAPVYVTNIGIAHHDFVSLDQLEPWIQDALDAIEFARGSPNTYWGRLRATYYNHPEPFPLKIVALGNEDCGLFGPTVYQDHYEAFARPIRSQWPDIRLIANCQLDKSYPYVDLYDYHVYQSPEWFYNNVHVFDKADRSGSHVFVSEYAVYQDSGPFGDLRGALAEAAFMTGLIRNSDVVDLASYAPLFVNVNDRTWKVNAIQFNSSAIAPIPSYYTQLIFGNNRGNLLVQSLVTGSTSGLEAIATYDSNSLHLILIVVNYSNQTKAVETVIAGTNFIASQGTLIQLTSASDADTNTIDEPNLVVPTESIISGISKDFVYQFPAFSLSKVIVQAF